MLPTVLFFASLGAALVPASKSVNADTTPTTATVSAPLATQFDTRADGIYVVRRGDDGEFEHVKVDEVNTSDVNATTSQQRRNLNWGGSGADVICDQSNFLWNANLWNSNNNGAYNGLATWCNYEGGPWAKLGEW